MKFVPILGSELSGSIGGITAAHNRGGPYFRQRVIPTDPQTPQQMAVRGYVAGLTSRWVDILTPVQRAAWDLYALNVPLPDAQGNPRNVGGLAMFVRSNVPRLQVVAPQVDDAPTVFNLGAFTNPSFDTFAAATQDFSCNFAIADDWVNEDGSFLFSYTSRTNNPSINFFKGPYRSGGVIVGNLALPPASPQTLGASFPIVAGNKTFVQIRISRADGRLTMPFRGFGVGA